MAAAKEAHAIYLQKLAQGILTRLPGTYVHEPAATLEALEPYERQASAYLRGLDPEDRPRLEQLVAECTRTLAALMDADARTSVLDSPNEREEMFRDLAGVYLRATDVVLSVCKAGWVAMTARLGRAEVLRRLAAGGTPEQARLLEAALAVLRVLKREWPDAKAHAPNPVRRAEFEFLMHNGLACVMGDQTMSCHAGGKGDRRWTEVAAELQEAARIAAEESVDPRLVVVCQVNKVLVSLYDPEAIAEVDPGFDARLTLRRVFITNPAYLEQCVRAFAVDPDFDSVRTELAELLGPYNRLN